MSNEPCINECRDNEQALACESVGRAHVLHHSFSYKHLLIIPHIIAVIITGTIINI